MSAHLSYVQLKVSNEARASEEFKLEQRRRDLLVLIFHYLQDEGWATAEHAGGSGMELSVDAVMEAYGDQAIIAIATNFAASLGRRGTKQETPQSPTQRGTIDKDLIKYMDTVFLDTARAFSVEAGPSLSKYDVCDNVDLTTILQEYEAYYFVKFKKHPKITKRTPSGADGCKGVKLKPPHVRRTGPTSISTSKNSVVSLPDLPAGRRGGMVWGVASDQEGSMSSTGKKDKGKSSSAATESGKAFEELRLTGSAIKEGKHTHQKDRGGGDDDGRGGRGKKGARLVTDARALLNNAIHDPTNAAPNHEDCLLKPVAGLAGYNIEMRELAAVISRDIYLQDPDVHWNDIIGLENAKRLVKEAVVYPIKYPQLFTGILSPWKGLLLYGPPGTGKTMLAKAVATECKTTFFNISASSIVSKWRGDSEKLIRMLFELARFHAPSTIFVDELESIMGQRAGFGALGGEHEGSRRMKTELLVQMDGLAKSSDLVFLLAASNIPWELDHAMLRRLEKRILVALPTQQARAAMFRSHLPAVVSPPPLQITSQVDYDVVAELTDGYSGSDIKLVCKEAAMQPVRQVFDKLESMTEERDSLENVVIDPIRTTEVKNAILRTKPSAKLLTQRYLQWQNEYESV